MFVRFSVFGLLLVFTSLMGCSGQAGLLDECSAVPLGKCAAVQTCCDSEECYFLVDGQEFACAAEKKCDAAIADVKTYCEDTSGSS